MNELSLKNEVNNFNTEKNICSDFERPGHNKIDLCESQFLNLENVCNDFKRPDNNDFNLNDTHFFEHKKSFHNSEKVLGSNFQTLNRNDIDNPLLNDTIISYNDVNIKVDDNGEIYLKDGKLMQNKIYKLNGNEYTTDNLSRIIKCIFKPQLNSENIRNIDAQTTVGGDDRKVTDQGGHIVGRDLNGDGGLGNLIAMDSKINQSDYKRMENDIKRALEEGKDVSACADISYSGDSERPDRITVKVTVDGKDTVYVFDNNLDGALDSEIIEKSPSAKAIIEDYPNSHVSSIKKEYSENGELVQTTACITYTDIEGNICRKRINISND